MIHNAPPTIVTKIKVNADNGDEITDLVSELKEDGFHPLISSGGHTVIVPLPQMRRPDAFRIPKQAEGLPLFLNAQEWGGRDNSSGASIIVCAMDGATLMPYRTLIKGEVANQTHACFSNPGFIVVIKANFEISWIEIIEYGVVQDHPVAWLDSFNALRHEYATKAVNWVCDECQRDFSEHRPERHTTVKNSKCLGQLSPVLNLPGILKHLQPAAQAAVDKANHYHCSDVHFYRPYNKVG